MTIFPKFIIELDKEGVPFMILGNCTFHKELATDRSRVRGGGLWKLDTKTKTFILSGESADFGKFNSSDVISCVTNKQIFESRSQIRNFVEEGFKFRIAEQEKIETRIQSPGEFFKLSISLETSFLEIETPSQYIRLETNLQALEKIVNVLQMSIDSIKTS